MPFFLLAVIALAFLQTTWPTPLFPISAQGSAIAQGLLVAGYALLVSVLVGRCRWQLLTAEPCDRPAVLRRALTVRRWCYLGWLFVAVLALYLTGWGRVVQQMMTFPAGKCPGLELVILLPLLVGVLFGWQRFYFLERTVHRLGHDRDKPFLSCREYLLLQTRQNFILAIPPFLLLVLKDLLAFSFPKLLASEQGMAILVGGLLGCLFVGQGGLMRLILGLKPLPPGPLRDRLMETARRLQFRYSDILVWNTHDTLATALLTGPLAFMRYVVLTDRLIEHMTEEEIEAVFGHEIGHVKHHHMLFGFGFMLTSIVLLLAAWDLCLDRIETVLPTAWLQSLGLFGSSATGWLLHLPFLLALAGYVFVVFGFLSRSGERQADLFACRNVSYEAFVSALEKVAHINGMSRHRRGWFSSWRHPTIDERIEFLRTMITTPSLQMRFQQTHRVVKLGMVLALACVFLLMGPTRVLALFESSPSQKDTASVSHSQIH